MARDDLGVRVERIATKAVKDGLPTVEGAFVGWANKSTQPGAFVDPSSAAITTIEVGEGFVMMVGGKHEVPISATKGHAPVGTAVDDLLYINPADNEIKKEAAVGFVPLGVVEEIDATRTPDVALVNTNALNAFLEVAE